jgi:hypothetical protein
VSNEICLFILYMWGVVALVIGGIMYDQIGLQPTNTRLRGALYVCGGLHCA